MAEPEDDNFTALDNLRNPFIAALNYEGLTPAWAAKQLKKLSKAKTTQFKKLKGAVGKTKRGVRVAAETGTIDYGEDGRSYSDGETMLALDTADNTTQLRATVEVIKMAGGYPDDKMDVTLNVESIIELLGKFPRDFADAVCDILKSGV